MRRPSSCSSQWCSSSACTPPGAFRTAEASFWGACPPAGRGAGRLVPRCLHRSACALRNTAPQACTCSSMISTRWTRRCSPPPASRRPPVERRCRSPLPKVTEAHASREWRLTRSKACCNATRKRRAAGTAIFRAADSNTESARFDQSIPSARPSQCFTWCVRSRFCRPSHYAADGSTLRRCGSCTLR